MKKSRVLRAMLFALCVSLCLVTGSLSVQAQAGGFPQTPARQTETTQDEINLDTQLFLLVGSNQDTGDSNLPSSLDGVLRQLRATLPFKNYRLAATLLNRVKNEGRLDLSWIGGPLAATAGPASTQTPSFSNFNVGLVKLVPASNGQQMVQMQKFNFGARIPIQVSGAIAANGAVSPNFNYERTGVATDISMREGEPVIVGTLNVGPSGDAIILVVSAKRTQK
jgi:hypothetical protein